MIWSGYEEVTLTEGQKEVIIGVVVVVAHKIQISSQKERLFSNQTIQQPFLISSVKPHLIIDVLST